MKTRHRQAIAAAGVLALGIAGFATPSNASLVVSSAVGGVPMGVSYVNFDNLPMGSAGGTSGSVGVSFTVDGQTVTGTSSGFYAPPYLSNSNGALFGDPTVSGPDTTRYLTTGIGTATLTFPAAEQYVGLLWGSVDSYNTLSLYNGSTLVGTVTGADVTAHANGNQGANGTYYVNIVSSLPFTSAVAASSQYAFEFDNVAFNPNSPVPEPLSLALLGLGILGAGFVRGHAKRRAG